MSKMQNLVTLIVILHNRHNNVERLMEYYKDFESPIILADSSTKAHVFKHKKTGLNHLYMPGISYAEKIEQTLKYVTTPYVVMCADDDFIVPSGLYQCVEFLENNKDYTVAQGLILIYYKYTINLKLRFGILYNQNYTRSENEPLQRLELLFSPYKSLLYAVHRTSSLQKAFNNAGKSIKNLYLNEYVASILPVLFGKSMDLPFLYQVREYSDVSDDKSTDNLEVILGSECYTEEVKNFQNLIIDNSKNIEALDQRALIQTLNIVLKHYSEQLILFKNQPISFKKYIGKDRNAKSKKALNAILTDKDFVQLDKIQLVLSN